MSHELTPEPIAGSTIETIDDQNHHCSRLILKKALYRNSR